MKPARAFGWMVYAGIGFGTVALAHEGQKLCNDPPLSNETILVGIALWPVIVSAVAVYGVGITMAGRHLAPAPTGCEPADLTTKRPT